MAGNASGEELFLASSVGEDLAGKNLKFSPPGGSGEDFGKTFPRPGGKLISPGKERGASGKELKWRGVRLFGEEFNALARFLLREYTRYKH